MSIPLFGKVAQKTHAITKAGVERLSTLDKCVLLVLADGERRSGGWFYVGYRRLGLYCGTTKRHVIRSVQRLEKWGALSLKKDERGGAGARNGYRVVSDDLIFREPLEKGVQKTPLKVSDRHPKGCPTDTTFQKPYPKALSGDEVDSSVPFPKLVEVGTSSHLVTDHTGENGKAKAKADKQAEKHKHKAVLSELGGILREVDVPFGLLTPKDIIEAWQAKGERLNPSLLPAVVRKIVRATLWKRVRKPAAYLVGMVKEEARITWTHMPAQGPHPARLQ